MEFLHIAVFCCLSAACAKAQPVLEVSGHVGGEVSIHCSVSWTGGDVDGEGVSGVEDMFFCRGACSSENSLIQSNRSAVSRRGRFSMEVDGGYGDFNVTIKELTMGDSGPYCCRAERRFSVSKQEVHLMVVDASTVPAGSPESLPRGGAQSTTDPAPAALTLPTTERSNKRATVVLTDTTVVIIISVSLALMVCALIPLVFYGHWRSNAEGPRRPDENGDQAECDEENADGATTQSMVKLQSLLPDPESSACDATQYAAMYQALDPKSLD